MTEWGTARLVDLTALFSAAVLLLLLMRPWLRRRGGATLLYAIWIQVPVVLLVLLLPKPVMPPPVAQVMVPLRASVTGAPQAIRSASPASFDATLLTIWAAGLALSLGVLVLSHLHYRRGLRRAGRGWRLAAGASAAMVGLPPRLALPIDFRQRYSALERRLVLAHERIHARRGDNAWTLLAWLIFATQWFNPLAWWALRRFRTDQELAVDAAVLQRFPGCRSAYTRALLKAQDRFAPALTSPCSRHPLVERIAMLNQSPIPLRRGLLLSLALCAAAGGYAAQMEPRAAAVQPGQVRVVMDVQFAGQLFPPIVHMALAGEEREYTVQGTDGRSYAIRASARPMPEHMIMVSVKATDRLSGKVLSSPRMMGRDGVPMRMEMRDQEGKAVLLGIDLLPRSADWQAARDKVSTISPAAAAAFAASQAPR